MESRGLVGIEDFSYLFSLTSIIKFFTKKSGSFFSIIRRLFCYSLGHFLSHLYHLLSNTLLIIFLSLVSFSRISFQFVTFRYNLSSSISLFCIHYIIFWRVSIISCPFLPNRNSVGFSVNSLISSRRLFFILARILYYFYQHLYYFFYFYHCELLSSSL